MTTEINTPISFQSCTLNSVSLNIAEIDEPVNEDKGQTNNISINAGRGIKYIEDDSVYACQIINDIDWEISRESIGDPKRTVKICDIHCNMMGISTCPEVPSDPNWQKKLLATTAGFVWGKIRDLLEILCDKTALNIEMLPAINPEALVTDQAEIQNE